eukprot:g41521.t1
MQLYISFFEKDKELVKYLNAYTGIVLIRCRKDFYRLLWSAMQLITFLESKNQKYPCFFNTLHVGGTIRTCQKFLIQYNRKQLLLLLKDCKTKGSPLDIPPIDKGTSDLSQIIGSSDVRIRQ